MPRQLSDEELEAVRLTEAAVDRRPLKVRASDTHLKPQDGQLKLYCPRHEGCSFGPGTQRSGDKQTLIQFGEVEPHVAIVPADHPLLSALRARKSYVVILEPGEEYGKVYTCEDCDREFPTKRDLKAHRAGGHRKAAPKKVATETTEQADASPEE